MRLKLPVKTVGILLLFILLPLKLFPAQTELEIYLDNKLFLGEFYQEGDEVFLELTGLKQLCSDRIDFNETLGLLTWEGKPLNSTRKQKREYKTLLFVSGRELALTAGGDYQPDPENSILNIYTFSPGQGNFSYPKAPATYFLNRDYYYPPIVQKVSAAIGELFDISLGDYPLEVKFVPAEEIEAKMQHAQAYVRETRNSQRKIEKYSIFISRELSTGKQVSYLAHEFAHCWQRIYAPPLERVDELLSEGFAEWIAFRTAEFLGYPIPMHDGRKNLYLKYSKGLSLYLELEEEYGKKKILRLLMEGYIPKIPPKYQNLPEKATD